MHALFVADREFASREYSILSRLRIGLADEGVRVTSLVPEDVVGLWSSSSFEQVIPFHAGPWWPGRGMQVNRVAAAVREAVGPDGPDVVHVFGGGVWKLASALARRLDAPAVVEAWRHGQGERLRGIWAAARGRSEAEHPDANVLVLAPDHAIEREVLKQHMGLPVRVCPWGVHVPPKARDVLRPGRPPSIAVIGGERDQAMLQAAVGACLAQDTGEQRSTVFVDADTAGRGGLWAFAKKLDGYGRLSIVDAFEHHRKIALMADVLLSPSTRGERRSVVLDAMAAGVPVVAAGERCSPTLEDGRNALLVTERTQESWLAALDEIVSDAERAKAMGRAAREHIRERHRPSAQIAAIVDAYEWLGGAAAIPMTGAGSGH